MSQIPRTVVHQLEAQADRLLDKPALWTRRPGGWIPTSWRQYAQRVKHAALGFQALGLKAGQAVAIMSFTREEWLVSDLGAMAAGGTPVGLYTTASEDQLEYVIAHAEAPIVVVENVAYLQRILAVKARLPKLKHLVVMDVQGVLPEGAISYVALLELGSKGSDAQYRASVEALKPDALATLIYTSGTTGHPKGVMLSHRNLCWTTAQLSTCARLTPGELLISYLPLSHIAEQVISIYAPIHNGIEVYFAQSFETLRDTIREVRPTAFFGVPRVWEKFKAGAENSMRQLTGAKARLLAWARGVATRYHQADLKGAQLSVTLEAQMQLARKLVFNALKARIGFDRCHIFASGAAPISREVLEFFASIDIIVYEVYGLSEVTGPATANTLAGTKLGTLGRPLPGVEVRIAPEGEILLRGDSVCLGYFKEPAATAELIREGWLHTGDVGELDIDGFLKITGRMKEIIVTSGGKKTPPSTLEALLKEIAPLGNAMVVGDNRNYLVALLALDPEQLEAFSQARQLPRDPTELAKHPSFREWLTREIETQVNAKVARFEQIKKFEVIPHDFTVEGGELTATLKLRRSVTAKKYAKEINALYE